MSTPNLSIEIRPKEGTPSRIKVAGQNLIIGRKDAQISLDSVTISRRHAEMLKDPFGRWWIRDLGSRNGTLVNGTRITESLIKPGDQIQIGDFSLNLLSQEDPASAAPTPIPSSAGHVQVAVVDGHAGKISTLQEVETPRLGASHLSIISEFGQQLLVIEDHDQRRVALCKLMVRPEFRARSAVALRASKESFTEPPRPLCPPQAAQGYEEWSPYISRTLLRAMLAHNEAALASNTAAASAPKGVDAAELSISSDVMAISAVAVPVKSENTYTDLLYIVLPPEFGTSEWLALAVLAVKQYQQAESTWAAHKLGEAHAAIERELNQAHAIQERLVPRNIAIPNLDFAIGFIPCKWVGGDYVDVVPGKNGKVLLTVADVCGKGLPAALVASSLHMMTHTAMRTNTPFPVIMQNLNVYLTESLAEGTFVTMLACLYDPATGTVDTINAGHPPGLFIAPDGKFTLTQSEANMPLGLDENSALQPTTTTLAVGTTLVMFTDGLTELPLEGGNLLGDDALNQHLVNIITGSPKAPTAELARQLSTLLDTLQHGMAQDDRTFLLARRL